MPPVLSAVLGVLALFLAGFVRGGAGNSPDPELVWGFSYALAGLGLIGVVAAGVATGSRSARAD